MSSEQAQPLQAKDWGALEQTGEAANVASKRHVRIRVAVKHLMNVDIVDQTFKCRVQLEASWELSARDDKDWPEEFKKVKGLLQRSLKERKAEWTKDPLKKDKSFEEWMVEQKRTIEDDSWPVPRREGEDPTVSDAEGALKQCLGVFDPLLSFTNMVKEDKENSEKWPALYYNGDYKAPGTVDNERQIIAEIEDDQAPLRSKPVMCLRWSFIGTFQEPLELRMFPLDFQDLRMTLKSGWPGKKVRLVKNQSSKYNSYVATSNFVQQQAYLLSDRVKFEPYDTLVSESATGTSYSLLRIMMHIDRYPNYWLLNIGLPLFMITSCALTSYSIKSDEDQDGFPDKLSVNIGVLVAIIGYKYMIAEKLPNLNYPTVVDQYVLRSFCMVGLVILLQTVGKNSHFFEGQVAYAMDFVAMTGVGYAAWILNNLFFLFNVWRGYRAELKQEAFWTWPESALWIGNFVTKDAGEQGHEQTPPKEQEVLEEVKKVTGFGAEYAVVWTPQKAKEYWARNPEVRNEFAKDNWGIKTERIFAERTTDDPTDYHGENVFAVVVYSKTTQAEDALKKFEESQKPWSVTQRPALLENARVELLHPTWRFFENRPRNF